MGDSVRVKISKTAYVWISSFLNSSPWKVNPSQRGYSSYNTSSESETQPAMASIAKLESNSTWKGVF